MVHASRGRLEPASPHLLSEPAIVVPAGPRACSASAARAPWEEFEKDYATIRDRIARVVPGFEDFNARVARPGGFTLPHAPRDERRFPTATGKANFTAAPVEYPEAARGPAAAADAALARPVQHHDLRPRRPLPRHQERPPRRPGQPRGRSRRSGSPTARTSTWSASGRTASSARAPGFRVVHYPTARGCAAAYYPETNVLVPLDSTADTSNTPASKSVVIRLEHIRRTD